MPVGGWTSRPELARPGGPVVREPERAVDSPFDIDRVPVPTGTYVDGDDLVTYVTDPSGGRHRIDPDCRHWAPKGSCRHACEGGDV